MPYLDVKLQSPKQELLDLLTKKSVFQGSFTLASGAQSDLYIDARLTTLDPRGAHLVGQIGWKLVYLNSGWQASRLGTRLEFRASMPLHFSI